MGSFRRRGFGLPLGLKDIELVLQTALAANVPMPTASLLRDRFVSAIAKGRSDLDWSAIALGAADDAGLKESRPEESCVRRGGRKYVRFSIARNRRRFIVARSVG